MRKQFAGLVAAILTLGLLVAGCASMSPVTPSGFLGNYDIMKEGKYFTQEYVTPKADFTKYTSVEVAPINFDYLADKTVCSTEDLEDLGKAFRKDIENQLTANGFELASGAHQNTLVLHVAITNIEIPSRLFNAAKSLAPFYLGFIPTDTDGITAFEAKVVDPATGKVLMEVAEKAHGSGGSFNVKSMAVGSYMKFVNAEVVFKTWAKKLGEMLAAQKGSYIK